MPGYTLTVARGNYSSDIVVREDADQSWDALKTQAVCGLYLPTDVVFVSASGNTYVYSSRVGQVVMIQANGYCHLYIS